jgi:hypothetical protein
MKRKFTGIVAGLVCASLAFSVPVYADPTEQQNTVSESEKSEGTAESNGSVGAEEQALTNQDAAAETAGVSPSAKAGPEIQCKDTDGSGRYIQITLENYKKPENVTGIQFAVWSEKGGQDDLHWYSAEKESDGTYGYKVDISEHKDTLGVYQVHVYASKTNGLQAGVMTGTFSVNQIDRPDPVVSVTGNSTEEKYEILASQYSMPAYGKDILVAVWSEEGGQDDLIWSEMEKKSGSEYRYQCNIADHRTSGKYMADIYLRHKDGSMEQLGGTSFEVTAPKCQQVTIKNKNEKAGTGTIVVEGISSKSGVDKVQIPVWNKADQSDLVWYTAEAAKDGTYQVDFNMANHGYHVGTYQIHVYVTTGNQIFSNVMQTNMTFEGSEAKVTSKLTSDRVLLRAENVMLPGGVEKVLFAVWSDENGQDDLRWNYADYQKEDQSGQYTIYLKDYKGFGLYRMDAYAQGPSGELTYLGVADFTV